MLNLDTHILIYALAGALEVRERKLLAAQNWSISGIVLWELEKLFQLGRISIDLESPAMMKALGRVHIWPITPEVCRQLRKLDFKSDPADELIAATSLAFQVPLMTRDRKIRKSSVVPLAF